MSAAETTRYDFEPAAERVKAIVAGITDGQLSAPTPCDEYTVAAVLDHVMGLTLAFTNAATKESTGAGSDGSAGRPEPAAANLDPDWRRKLAPRLDALVVAWRDPAAWTGMAEAGGFTMPADVMGAVAVNELVLHGWDLARATGQAYDCDEASAEASLTFTSMMSTPGEEAGRAGLFGPVVEVPADASTLDRTLGYSGRDPFWAPPG